MLGEKYTHLIVPTNQLSIELCTRYRWVFWECHRMLVLPRRLARINLTDAWLVSALGDSRVTKRLSLILDVLSVVCIIAPRTLSRIFSHLWEIVSRWASSGGFYSHFYHVRTLTYPIAIRIALGNEVVSLPVNIHFSFSNVQTSSLITINRPA